MLILNDIHEGFTRAGGTTPASQEALRSYLNHGFRSVLETTKESHVCIAGDLFDDFEVSNRDFIETYSILASLLADSFNKLTLVAGNHDHSAKGEKVSSFQLLCRILKDQFPEQLNLVMVDAWSQIDPGVWALAHCSNQTLFDQRLSELLEVMDVLEGGVVLLHANYHNNFVVSSDHSLNVTEAQALAFKAKGVQLMFAHEHQARTALDGDVVVFGNQWPTSIQDCLGNHQKFAHILTVDELETTLKPVLTWDATWIDNGFSEVDWRELDDVQTTGFMRVVGTASAPEASAVVNAIATFRQKSSAFVITNGVKVDGIVQAEALPATFEAAKKFDVMSYIAEHMNEEEMAAIKLLAGE